MRAGVAAALVAALLLGVLLVRARVELSRGLERAAAAHDSKAKGVALAEAARWALPLTGEREQLLGGAMAAAEALEQADPDGARAVAEEVRATLFAVRLASPPRSPLLKEANAMIVRLLAQRDRLSPQQVEELRLTYEEQRGPAPLPYALSSLSFVVWLVGLWLAVRREGSGRRLGLLLAAIGLAGFVGFIAVA